MSAVALIMNILLGVLLMAALGMGWRLERRLKALRESQNNFVQAVGDLDRAAARAEQGLADLRAATDEASDALAGRIDRAQHLAARLDTALNRGSSAHAPANTLATDAARARADLRADSRDLRNDLILEEDGPLPPRRPFSGGRVEAAVAALRSPSPTPPPMRPRPRFDDDLFDDAGARAALGARR